MGQYVWPKGGSFCLASDNIIEQDHRPSKKAMYVALGFKSFEGAAATLSGVEVVRIIKKNQLSCFETQQTSYQKFCSLVA